jgi:PEP-CTERM motif-containing protein
MKRILATVAALAGLGYTSLAGAAIITFDESGLAAVNSVSSFASDPSLPPGTTGSDPVFGPFFIGKASLGSSMTINTDLNGNGIIGEADDVGVTGGTLVFDLTTPIGALGSIESHSIATATGGLGTLTGDTILWDNTGAPGTGTFWNVTGTWTCHGAGLCGLIGIPDGSTFPLVGPPLPLNAVTGTVPVAPTLLGTWILDPTHTSIAASSWNTIQLGGPTVSAPLAPGVAAQWYTFGSADLGHQAPEPGTIALVLLGIGGLALRSRKA